MRVLAVLTLLSAVALLPAAGLAQDGQQQPAAPAPAATGGSGSGKPANLCQELAAFVHQPDAAAKSDAKPKDLSTAVQGKSAGEPASKPSDSSGAPQQTSGQSGQVTSSGPGAAGPQGDAQNKVAPPGSTATAAAPPKDAPAPTAAAAPAAPKPSPEAVQQIETAAASNDQRGCREAAQKMRRAGVAMPAPLLALSAMDPKLLEAAQRP